MNTTQNLINEISTKIQFNIDKINKHLAEIGLKEVFSELHKDISEKILLLESINVEELLEIEDYEEIIAGHLLDIYRILVDFDKVQKISIEEDDLIFGCLQNLESSIKELFDVVQYEELNVYFGHFKNGLYDNEELCEYLYYYRDLI